MATNIPPHNLGEIIRATDSAPGKARRDARGAHGAGAGPGFPDRRLHLRAQRHPQRLPDGAGDHRSCARGPPSRRCRADREAIIVTEIPYQINKAKLIERIAELVRDKKLEGISDLRDESDREGMRIVIELKKDEPAQVVLNNLYKLTPMQSSFGIILLAIVHNQPRVLTCARCSSVSSNTARRSSGAGPIFELRKAEARAHILEGLKRALDLLDEIIALIRASKEPARPRRG